MFDDTRPYLLVRWSNFVKIGSDDSHKFPGDLGSGYRCDMVTTDYLYRYQNSQIDNRGRTWVQEISIVKRVGTMQAWELSFGITMSGSTAVRKLLSTGSSVLGPYGPLPQVGSQSFPLLFYYDIDYVEVINP